jgi:hypothetical protein
VPISTATKGCLFTEMQATVFLFEVFYDNNGITKFDTTFKDLA